MKKLFIHIGLPKTATSSIQHFLFHNRSFLNRHGYHYVNTGLNNHLHCHHDLVWKLGLHSGLDYLPKDIQDHQNRVLDELAAENNKYREKHLVISSELLTFLDDFRKLEPILTIFKDRTVKFILNLRRQDAFLESLYLQVVKNGIGDTFHTWYPTARSVADYCLLINNILQITEKNNLIVGLFNSRQKDFNPAEAFLSSIGIEDESFAVENRFQNERLPTVCIKIIRLSNSLNLKINYKLVDFFTKHKDRILLLNSNQRFLNDQQRTIIREEYRASNEALASQVVLPLEVRQEILSW